MTLEEFSNEFDTLIDSYKRFKKFDDQEILDSLEFNEYEKSIFLTKAQEKLVISFYNGKNPMEDSFEKTEEIRRYLNNLIKTSIITKKENLKGIQISNTSYFFKLPDDLWFVTYESVKFNTEENCLDAKDIVVQPITQNDYYRISRNPFRQSNARKVLRLDIGDNIVELISRYEINSYYIRYLIKPSPIILVNLTNESIDNIKTKTECKLNTAIHRLILEEAVRMAITSKVGNAENNKQTK